jgi:hypothetical protein
MEQVAGAYANALVEVAKKTSSLEAVHADVDALASMLKDNAVRRRACRSTAGAPFPAWRAGAGWLPATCTAACAAMQHTGTSDFASSNPITAGAAATNS